MLSLTDDHNLTAGIIAPAITPPADGGGSTEGVGLGEVVEKAGLINDIQSILYIIYSLTHL